MTDAVQPLSAAEPDPDDVYNSATIDSKNAQPFTRETIPSDKSMAKLVRDLMIECDNYGRGVKVTHILAAGAALERAIASVLATARASIEDRDRIDAMESAGKEDTWLVPAGGGAWAVRSDTAFEELHPGTYPSFRAAVDAIRGVVPARSGLRDGAE